MQFEAILEALVQDDEVEFRAAGGVVYWFIKEGKVLCEGSPDDILVDLHHPDSLEILSSIYKNCHNVNCTTSLIPSKVCRV